MSGFAKVFGDGAAQVVVMCEKDATGNALVTFYTHVDNLGTKGFSTVFKHNQTADDDAALFFDAVDENLALARGAMIRDLWAASP